MVMVTVFAVQEMMACWLECGDELVGTAANGKPRRHATLASGITVAAASGRRRHE